MLAAQRGKRMSVSPATSAQAGPRASMSRASWTSLATVSLGYLLVSWGMAPVSSILPTISADLNIDVSAAGWIMNAYFLLLVGAVLVTGRFGDIVGHRRGFAAGVAVFGVAGVAAGLVGC